MDPRFRGDKLWIPAQGRNDRKMDFLTNSAEETKAAAKKIIIKLLKRPHPGALVLALAGELGAGKTTFVQGLAKALGIKEKILSPTFVILKRYGVRPLGRDKGSPAEAGTPMNFYHLDCYRIQSAKDLAGLGFEKILKNKNNLVVIEWAERVKTILPADTVWIEFKHGGEDERRIKILNFKD